MENFGWFMKKVNFKGDAIGNWEFRYEKVRQKIKTRTFSLFFNLFYNFSFLLLFFFAVVSLSSVLNDMANWALPGWKWLSDGKWCVEVEWEAEDEKRARERIWEKVESNLFKLNQGEPNNDIQATKSVVNQLEISFLSFWHCISLSEFLVNLPKITLFTSHSVELIVWWMVPKMMTAQVACTTWWCSLHRLWFISLQNEY